MLRSLTSAVLAAAATALGFASANAESYTTRIEPRAFYGATVTIESGVRVFRPLPVERQVIINPGGQTPLSLGINDTRVVETSTSNNYYYDQTSRPNYYGGGTPGFYGGYYPRWGQGHHGDGHFGRSGPLGIGR